MATKKDGLYKKRYKTLKEHRAAVKARKLMEQKGGKNVGPVSAGAEYGRKLAKPKKTETKRVPKGGSNAKPAASKPRQTTPAEAKARFFSSSSQGSIAKNQEKAKRNFFRGSRGGAPKRSDFPAGRGGQAKYAAAKRRYEKGGTPTRRGRLTTAQRRAARRSSR